jgi:cystathionine beta-lyase
MGTIDAEAAGRAIAFVSASKAWNLPGLKAALAVACGADGWALLSTLPRDVTFGTGLLGVIANEAAFLDGEPWLDALLAGLDDNRGLLATLLAQQLPAVGYVPPQGTFLAWLDLRGLALAEEPADVLRESGRVALYPGPMFGAPGRGHVRLNFATSPELLEEGVRRMAAVLAA